MRPDPARLDSLALGLAAASVAAMLFTVCALAVALAPDAAVLFASDMIHVDLTGLARSLTWGSFVVALLCWGFGTGLVFAAAAGLYNRFLPDWDGAGARAG